MAEGNGGAKRTASQESMDLEQTNELYMPMDKPEIGMMLQRVEAAEAAAMQMRTECNAQIAGMKKQFAQLETLILLPVKSTVKGEKEGNKESKETQELPDDDLLHPNSACNCIEPIAKDWKGSLVGPIGSIKVDTLCDLAKIITVERMDGAKSFKPADIIRKYKGVEVKDITAEVWEETYTMLCPCRMSALQQLEFDKNFVVPEFPVETQTGINKALMGEEGDKKERGISMIVPDNFLLVARSNPDRPYGTKFLRIERMDFVKNCLEEIEKDSNNMLIVLPGDLSHEEWSTLKSSFVNNEQNRLIVFSINPIKMENPEMVAMMRKLSDKLAVWRYESNNMIEIATLNGRLIGNFLPFPLTAGTIWMSSFKKLMQAVNVIMGVKNSDSLKWTNDEVRVKKRYSVNNSDSEARSSKESKYSGISQRQGREQCYKCKEFGHISYDCGKS